MSMDAAEFAEHVNHISAAGFTSLLLSLGHKLGLFDLMMKENRPVTSKELAELAGMKERYVREWLCGVASGKLVSYDPGTETFCVPKNHHDALKGPAAFTDGIVAFSAREEELIQCFMKDGPYGITYNHDEITWHWIGTWKMIVCPDLIEKAIVPNLKWTALDEKLEAGINVLDVCCGSGEITLHFAKLFPRSLFTGLELFEIPRKKAIEQAEKAGLDNVSIIGGDAHNLPEKMSDNYDMVLMVDSLHDLPNPHKALSQTYKVLKPDGHLVVMDIGVSSNLEDNIGTLSTSMMHTCSLFCCLPSSMSEEPRVGYGACWGRQNIEAALKQVYNIVRSIQLSPMSILFICTKR